MGERFTIFTVCAGNVHRSPLAAALLGRWCTWYLPSAVAADVAVRSAGLVAPVGAPMGSTAQTIARALGADASQHAAAALTDRDINAADLVLVATARQRDDVAQRVPTALRKTFTIREAGRIAASIGARAAPGSIADLARTVAELSDRRLPDDGSNDIIDPNGLGVDAYIQMAQEEIPPLAQLAEVLFGMPPVEVKAYLDVVGSQESLLAELRRAEREE
ncbi:hypothetical protein [Microbacterium sp.]|uniref:arsenate reductase/protein-tyrosine-phosphatase family protein n=1 Tax=Microbacterium sp. TaxID=51671 RepID=UPI003C18C215